MRIEIDQDKVLAAAKAAKLQDLAQWQNELTQTYEWEGHIFQTDSTARERMVAVYPMALEGRLPANFEWRLLNDVMIPLSNEQFTNLYEAIVACHQKLIYSVFRHKDTIKDLATVEEIEAYEFFVIGAPDGE